MAGYQITSPSNERVKRLVRLQDRRHRDAEQVFAVEEERILRRAIAAGHAPLETYLCPDRQPPIRGVPHVTMSPEANDRASYRKTGSGLIALFGYLDVSLDRLDAEGDVVLVVAEGLEKPGNLGALLRICDGAGVGGLIVVGDGTDVFNPNAVRASTGALFTVPVAAASIAEATGWLVDTGARSVGADPEADLVYWDADLTGRCAVWVGAEAEGLSSLARQSAQILVSIPMAGAADSLNTSVAASLIVYESIRQRLQA